jgi:CRP-like cAMP-binding protein
VASEARSQNGFLNSLSADDFETLGPHLRTVELSQGRSLIKFGDPVKYAYFPHSGVCSLIVELEEGESAEVAMVGRNSLLGAFSAMGETVATYGAVVMLPGVASMLDIEHLREAAERSTALSRALIRHGQAVFVQAQQTVGCNTLHSVEARLARWLLRVRDLAGSDQFTLTQEMMAQMIGARRNSVSIVAHTLQQANYIRYSRGHIEIIDPDGLSNTTCRCYPAIKMQYENLTRSVEQPSTVRRISQSISPPPY